MNKVDAEMHLKVTGTTKYGQEGRLPTTICYCVLVGRNIQCMSRCWKTSTSIVIQIRSKGGIELCRLSAELELYR